MPRNLVFAWIADMFCWFCLGVIIGYLGCLYSEEIIDLVWFNVMLLMNAWDNIHF